MGLPLKKEEIKVCNDIEYLTELLKYVKIDFQAYPSPHLKELKETIENRIEELKDGK